MQNKIQSKSFLRRFFKRQIETIPAYYKDASKMPMSKWVEFNHWGNAFKYMFVESENVKVKEWHLHYLVPAVEKIREEIIQITGISQDFIRKIEIEAKIALLEWEYETTDNAANLIFRDIELDKLKLMELSNENKGYKDLIASQKIQIEKYMKMPIRLTDISVREFYEYTVNINK